MDDTSVTATGSDKCEKPEPDHERATFAVHYTVPGYDGFFRSQPAILEGPKARWNAARQVIDFGA